MRRFEVNRGRDTAAQRFLITCRTKAPLIARFEPWEAPLRMRRYQIVSLKDGVVEKLTCHLYTNGVLTDVVGARATVSISIETGHRVAATTAELGSEHISQHTRTIAQGFCYSQLSRKMSVEIGAARKCRPARTPLLPIKTEMNLGQRHNEAMISFFRPLKSQNRRSTK